VFFSKRDVMLKNFLEYNLRKMQIFGKRYFFL